MNWIQKLRSRLDKSVRNEKGISLIEVIVALMIMSMVITILYSFLLMGVSMYKRVIADTQMRNQGDILYSQILTELNKATIVKPVYKAGGLIERSKSDSICQRCEYFDGVYS